MNPPTLMIPRKEMIHTADVTNRDLAAAREAAGLYQWQVAALLHVSDDTVGRWERGEYVPSPDQVDAMEKLYKAPGLWYGHMRYTYKSFRERYPEEESGTELAMSMVQAMYQMADVTRRQDDAIRDALDGEIHNERGFAAYIEEVKKLHAALGRMLAQAERKGG